MTKKQFWQSSSNWGFAAGLALFAMNLVGWWLKLETADNSWFYELLLFIVICPLIVYTGRRNAILAGAEGYSYGRAVGYVFATMMFAGIVYGVGRFLLMNFIARGYYDALNESTMDAAIAVYQNTPMYDSMLEMQSRMVRMLSNPFYLIFTSILGMVTRGGFLGLVLCAFFAKKPDPFAPTTPTASADKNTTTSADE